MTQTLRQQLRACRIKSIPIHPNGTPGACLPFVVLQYNCIDSRNLQTEETAYLVISQQHPYDGNSVAVTTTGKYELDIDPDTLSKSLDTFLQQGNLPMTRNKHPSNKGAPPRYLCSLFPEENALTNLHRLKSRWPKSLIAYIINSIDRGMTCGINIGNFLRWNDTFLDPATHTIRIESHHLSLPVSCGIQPGAEPHQGRIFIAIQYKCFRKNYVDVTTPEEIAHLIIYQQHEDNGDTIGVYSNGIFQLLSDNLSHDLRTKLLSKWQMPMLNSRSNQKGYICSLRHLT